MFLFLSCHTGHLGRAFSPLSTPTLSLMNCSSYLLEIPIVALSCDSSGVFFLKFFLKHCSDMQCPHWISLWVPVAQRIARFSASIRLASLLSHLNFPQFLHTNTCEKLFLFLCQSSHISVLNSLRLPIYATWQPRSPSSCCDRHRLMKKESSLEYWGSPEH